MQGCVFVGCADDEVRLEVLSPIAVLLAAGSVGRDPCSRVTDIEEVEEPDVVAAATIEEPLFPTIVDASKGISPLVFRVLVEDILRYEIPGPVGTTSPPRCRIEVEEVPVVGRVFEAGKLLSSSCAKV